MSDTGNTEEQSPDETEGEVGSSHEQRTQGSKGVPPRRQGGLDRRSAPIEAGYRQGAEDEQRHDLVERDGGLDGELLDPGPNQPELDASLRVHYHRGPLPSARWFADTKAVDPEIPNTVIRMADRDSKTQNFAVRVDVLSNGVALVVGAMSAWVVPAACLAGAVVMVLVGGGPWVAGIVAAIGGLYVVTPKIIAAIKGEPSVQDPKSGDED